MNSLTNPPLIYSGPGASSTPLHVLLKAYPSLEDNLGNDKACHQLGTFEGRLAPWTTNMCLDRLNFLARVVTLFWQTGQGGEGQVICIRDLSSPQCQPNKHTVQQEKFC